jgi:outer membrane lipoprotein-sorting protein
MPTQPAHPETIVDAAVVALRETAVADHPSAALVERTIAAMQSHGGRPRPAATGSAGWPIRAGWWRLGIAATVGVAAVLALVLAPGLTGRDANAAFAAMLQKVREVKSVRYRVTVHGVTNVKPGNEISYVVIETADGSRVTCDNDSQVEIYGPAGSLFLDPTSRTAFTDSSEKFAVVPDLLSHFRNANGGLGQPLDGKRVGTVAAHGYRVSRRKWSDGGDGSMRVYVDPATDLPVRVEEDLNGEPKAGFVLSDFEWDIKVDPQLLSLDPPAGYRHETARAITPPEAIAAGLRLYADRMTGSLPNALEGFEATSALFQTYDDEEKNTLPGFAPWFHLRKALEDLRNKNTPVQYLGKGGKAGDATQIVAWWKGEKPGRVVAIYGDFSVKEIDESAAPRPATDAGR